MKNLSVSRWVHRAVLGALLFAGSASAHPGHPGHDFAPSAAGQPDVGHLLPAVIVTALALFVSRGVFRKLP